MEKDNFIKYLKNPQEIEFNTVKELKAIVEEYPFFQSARVLYLKGLKNQESFKYNNELKITSAYTTDRTVLFNFITSKTFNTNKAVIKELETEVEELVEEVKKDLEIGKPLTFSKNELHSFSQWLQLSVNQPVDKKEELEEKSEKLKDKKSIQNTIIERFIINKPKISRIEKNTSLESKVLKNSSEPQLMTETLAKVYLEQKKYENAIKAYEILSLKYPEKSGFFADRIKQIRILQNN